MPSQLLALFAVFPSVERQLSLNHFDTNENINNQSCKSIQDMFQTNQTIHHITMKEESVTAGNT